MKFRVLIEQDKDGIFLAEVPNLPGCVSQGSTRAEAIGLYLESLAAYNVPIPSPLSEEIVKV